MKYLLSTCSFIIFWILIIGCLTNEEPIAGGPCDYKSDTGYVKILAFGDTVNHRIQTVFNFYDNPHILILEYVMMDSACINRNSIAVSDSFYCIRHKILKGTCAPIIYEIDTTSCFYYY